MAESFYFFKSKNGKEYRFNLCDARSSRHLSEQSAATVYITSDPIENASIRGYIFPVLKNKDGLYVKWWCGWLTHLWIPSDVRKRIDKIVKLVMFT